MKTQHRINKEQGVINEKTRLDLRVNNVWAILVSVAVSAFVFGVSYAVMNTKLDTVISNQNEMKQDFKAWKNQWEGRLGNAEKDVVVLQTKAGLRN